MTNDQKNIINMLQKIIDIGLLATLILYPFSINIALISPKDIGHPLIAINFSLSDLCIGILLLLWIIKLIIERETSKIVFPPVQIIAFVIVVFLTFVNSFSMSQWAKETIQMTEYFFFYSLLLVNNLKTINLKTIKNIFFISTSITLFIAFIQYSFFEGDPYLVRGPFNNHNILGSFLCISIPIVFIESIYTENIVKKIWMFSLLLISLIILTSGNSLLSILISLIIMSMQINRKTVIQLLSGFIFLGAVYYLVMPEKNSSAIKEFASIYESGSISNNYYRRLALLNDIGSATLFRKNVGENFIKIKTNDLSTVKIPEYEPGEGYKEMDDETHIKNRYTEMQASLNLISEHTLLGVGPGNFQSQIGLFYTGFPKVNTAEPNQHNGYLIVGSTMGLLGLTIIFWIFFESLRNTKKKIHQLSKQNYFYLGLYGSIICCMIENLFSNLLIASLLVPLLFIIHLSSSKKNFC